ncbi:MAG: hypothetical protein H6Q14_1108 [Bacteroidetes bacterium]|jgi:hypothetical protein|nr:hypothetical protein [Bacteroidota bacterium]
MFCFMWIKAIRPNIPLNTVGLITLLFCYLISLSVKLSFPKTSVYRESEKYAFGSSRQLYCEAMTSP